MDFVCFIANVKKQLYFKICSQQFCNCPSNFSLTTYYNSQMVFISNSIKMMQVSRHFAVAATVSKSNI